ncbi:hypothetical protein K443DRAFT_349926 [Laccaria amethystina LaAM-08-1]|uniref:ER membrane protein complex subunit 6 n=1 Tax=Laccaria amethystina LaAM-08-1 TaxID=1095629 RepID=A0A0C9WJI1_9AGAR|nr:hypothetical protein K443DRAFT_349926 [Laccaria amethystina LaAM-08-1]
MSTTEETAAQLIYGPNVVANSSLTTVKFLSACFAGAAAGILGLENWLGFTLFLTSTILTSVCIYTINCHGKPAKFIHGGVTELVNPGQDNIFTFVLVWTLFYGLSPHLHVPICKQFILLFGFRNNTCLRLSSPWKYLRFGYYNHVVICSLKNNLFCQHPFF